MSSHRAVLVVLSAALAVLPGSVSPASAAFLNVLILHDSGGPWGYLGGEYALMAKNLLGHFSATVTTRPVTTYTAGLVNSFDATFYIGSTYEEWTFYGATSTQRVNYDAFLADVATTDRTVVWMNYNLWRLAWGWNTAWGPSFAERFGFWFGGLQGVATGHFYNRVLYKNTELLKGVVPWANPGADLTGCRPEAGSTAYACNPDLSQAVISDVQKAQAFAWTYSTLVSTGSVEQPYITRGRNLWLVGDMPFSYHSEEDRYLAFADVLHDMLGIDHPESHRAMVRLEDVSPGTNANDLRQATDLLKQLRAPFGVATVAFYRDPSGIYNGGRALSLRLAGSTVGGILRTLATTGWASIIQHGTTHQWDGAPNPYNRVTGDDFEFYRVRQNTDGSLTFVGPITGDSTSWARNRMQTGRTELTATGLTAFAWEAPHYTASAVDYAAIRSQYPIHYGRLVYFPTGSPAGRFLGQFYPYVIEKDHYGYKLLPENIGYIEPAPFPGYRPLYPADLVRHAIKARVVRDGFASFYYHADLGTNYLRDAVTGIAGAGYTFVAPCSVSSNCTVTPAVTATAPQAAADSASFSLSEESPKAVSPARARLPLDLVREGKPAVPVTRRRIR
jgi:uncharacterized protein YdaL